MLLLLLVTSLVAVYASSSPLRTAWLTGRTDPQATHALLFENCSLNADATILNDYTCSTNAAAMVIGCLSTHRAYACSLDSGRWVQLT